MLCMLSVPLLALGVVNNDPSCYGNRPHLNDRVIVCAEVSGQRGTTGTFRDTMQPMGRLSPWLVHNQVVPCKPYHWKSPVARLHRHTARCSLISRMLLSIPGVSKSSSRQRSLPKQATQFSRYGNLLNEPRVLPFQRSHSGGGLMSFVAYRSLRKPEGQNAWLLLRHQHSDSAASERDITSRSRFGQILH